MERLNVRSYQNNIASLHVQHDTLWKLYNALQFQNNYHVCDLAHIVLLYVILERPIKKTSWLTQFD